MYKYKKAKLSINLVTWQAENYLFNLGRSIVTQSFKDFSVLVIDNASLDKTTSFLKENYPQFKLIVNKNNNGFAKAHNQAIHWTDSQYILCLNQDIILTKNFLKICLDFLDKNPEVAAVTGKLLRYDNKENKSTDIIDSTGLKIFKSHRIIDRDQGNIDNGLTRQQSEEVFGVSGACPIYRREALEKIKVGNEYFDETFFNYKEDVDLAFRLRLNGWKAFYLPKAVAYHCRSTQQPDKNDKNKEIAKNRRRKNKYVNYYSYKNHLALIIKNEFLKNIIRCAPHIFFYELKKLLYVLFFEQKTLMAFVDFIKLLPAYLKKRKIIKKIIRQINSKDLYQWYE